MVITPHDSWRTDEALRDNHRYFLANVARRVEIPRQEAEDAVASELLDPRLRELEHEAKGALEAGAEGLPSVSAQCRAHAVVELIQQHCRGKGFRLLKQGLVIIARDEWHSCVDKSRVAEAAEHEERK